jgi:hypothetical protein
MGCPVCTNSFPGESHHNYTQWFSKEFVMQKKNKSLFMQDNPGSSLTPAKSHCFRSLWRKITFQVLFKGLEVLLMILEIIQCLCEIFKK